MSPFRVMVIARRIPCDATISHRIRQTGGMSLPAADWAAKGADCRLVAAWQGGGFAAPTKTSLDSYNWMITVLASGVKRWSHGRVG